jgi:streptomycin 6-kinase
MYDPREFAAQQHAPGREWIHALPGLTAEMCRRWDLVDAGGPVHNGYRAVVRSVTQRGSPYVLKLSWPAETVVTEALALRAWNGDGAVQLMDFDEEHGALLLEQLDAQRTLGTLPVLSAARVAGDVLRRLAIRSPGGLPTTQERAAEIAATLRDRQQRNGDPIPDRFIDTATSMAEAIAARDGARLLVHADLHYGNVLGRGDRAWAAIDPKSVTGDPEHAVPELMWTRVDDVSGTSGVRQLLNTIVDAAHLDPHLAMQWVVVRCVDYWLWGLEHRLTEDPVRCARILEGFV